MEPAVGAQLGMERGDDDGALPAQHRMAVDRRQQLDGGTGPLDEWCTDEHRREGSIGIVDPRHHQIGLEAVDLTPEGVPPHVDVDRTETPLVGPPVEDRRPEQDHPRARPEGRHAGRDTVGDRVEQAGGLEEHRHRRALASGKDEGVDGCQLLGGADLSRLGAERGQATGVGRERALQGEDADLHAVHLGASHASAGVYGGLCSPFSRRGAATSRGRPA